MALDISRFIGRFVEEARDHLGKLAEGIAALEGGQADAEQINAIFRSAHTIKGSSRMLKLITVSDTAHKMEDVLGALRSGKIAYDPELGRLLYRAVDALSVLVDQVADSAPLPPLDEALCAALAAAAEGASAPVVTPAADPPAAEPPAGLEPAGGSVESEAATIQPPHRDAISSRDGISGSPAAAPRAPVTAPSPDERLRTPDTVRVRLAKLDELLKLMGEVVSSHARLRQRLADARALERTLADCGVKEGSGAEELRRFTQSLRDDVSSQELLMGELHDKALIMRMLPLSIVFDPAARLVRELARSLGKEVECKVAGGEIELDRQMIDRLSDPIVHLLRNAVDHGVEQPEARRAAGKPEYGRIRLGARQDGGWVVIEAGDDGAGLSLDRIRDKAVRRGLMSAERAAALSESEVGDLIFLPGFSTSPIVTDVSGRGVGMDVVKKTVVDDLQGVVTVESRPGSGTSFLLRLPLSLAMMRVLLCRSGTLPFAVTAQYVAELVRTPPETLLNVAGRRATIRHNEFVPVVELAPLLGLPGSTETSRRGLLLLLVVQVRSEKLALAVDELLDERDMVIKPLPAHLSRLTLVSGMVVTGRSELVSVLHVPALLELARAQRGESVSAKGAAAEGRDVLVVDDSLNTREIVKEVLEAHGYRVTLAEDGLDGWQQARAGRFDAVLTDVEMPGLDGFSLTSRLREEERYRHIPIVIVTSRSTEEDKRRGIQVGADAYIVKGDFDQGNLVDILGSLLG